MARLDVNQTFDDVKRLILNYVETRIDFGGVPRMDVGNIAHPEQWLDHQEGGALENVAGLYECPIRWKGKGKESWQVPVSKQRVHTTAEQWGPREF